MKTYEEIRQIYVTRYPHLNTLKRPRDFAKAALMLAAPRGITPNDTWLLSKCTTPIRNRIRL
jgi:hypothetical protein